MERCVVSLLNTQFEAPDPLLTGPGVARWWLPAAPSSATMVKGAAKPRFDAALARELRALRGQIETGLAQGKPPQTRFSGSAAHDAILFAVAHAAVSLWERGEMERVRRCCAGDCGAFFFDRTKNASRRWCSLRCMERARSPRRRKVVK